MELTIAEKRKKAYRRNFFFFAADNSIYGFVASIFSQSTILPHYISTMTDSKTLLGLLPAIIILSNIAQVVSSVYSIRAVNKRPMMIVTSLLQRMGFVCITASCSVLRLLNPTAGLTAFFISYIAYGLSNAYMSPIWSSVFAGAITENRGLLFGLTSLFSNALGFFGAFLTRSLLQKISYPSNFETIFIIGTAVSFLSFASLALVKYYPDPAEARPDFTFRKLFQSVREILRVNLPYRRFLVARAAIAVGEVSFGFLTANFVSRFALSEGEVGTANIVLIVSQCIFPLAIGRLRDKKGGETAFMLISAIGVVALAIAIFAPTALIYYAVFVLLGAMMSPIYMATNTGTMSYADKDLVPAYTAITGLSLIPFSGFGSLFAGALGDAFGYEAIYCLSIAGFVAAFVLFARQRRATKTPRPN